jgi:hypothetical protein
MRAPLALRRLRGLLPGVLLLAAGGACGPPRAYPLTAPRPQQGYPARFEVWSDDDLNEWTLDLEHKTPGWTIVLDAHGMLARATCDACRKGDLTDLVLTSDDRRRIEDFLTVNGEALLGLQGEKMQAVSSDTQLICRQKTPLGEVGAIWIDRFGGTVHISGHFWPGVPSPEASLSDAALEAKLRSLDPGPGLAVSHEYVHTQGAKGAVEIHEAACLRTTDVAKPPRETASHPCIDARSGERLTPGWEAEQGPPESLQRAFHVFD